MSQQSTPRGLLIATIVFFVTSIGLGIFALLQSNTVKEKIVVVEEGQATKEELSSQADALDQKVASLEDSVGENRESVNRLRDSLEQFQNELQAKTRQLSELQQKNYRAQFNRIRRQYQELKARRDSLKAQNTQLVLEQDTLGKQLRAKRDSVQEQAEKRRELAQVMKKGRSLQAYNLTFKALKENVWGNEKETDNARSISKIEACCTLERNQLARKGKLPLFFLVVQPNGEALHKREENTFRPRGSTGDVFFTDRKEVEYKGQAQEVCFTYQLRDATEMSAGKHKVEFYYGRDLVGSKEIKLD
jgi:regulator of replication initiation timing